LLGEQLEGRVEFDSILRGQEHIFLRHGCSELSFSARFTEKPLCGSSLAVLG
jgi:hypothetical protein